MFSKDQKHRECKKCGRPYYPKLDETCPVCSAEPIEISDEQRDEIERLRRAERDSIQSTNGSDIFKVAADALESALKENEALRAENERLREALKDRGDPQS